MRFRTPEEEEPKLGITPLIDIVFLLLIFFMLTSHFNVATGVPVTLPKLSQKAVHGEVNKVCVVIDSSGGIYLKKDRVALKELGPRLEHLVKKGNVSQLQVEADKDAKHGRVVQVMDIAKRAGISTIIIAARWDPLEGF